MISVIVTYQIKKEFVEQNQANIQKFVQDFEKLDATQFEYKIFTKQDGLTFVHHSLYKNETIQKQLLNIPSFLEFQKQRDEIGLIGKAQIEILNLFASSDEKWKI